MKAREGAGCGHAANRAHQTAERKTTPPLLRGETYLLDRHLFVALGSLSLKERQERAQPTVAVGRRPALFEAVNFEGCRVCKPCLGGVERNPSATTATAICPGYFVLSVEGNVLGGPVRSPS